MSGGRSLRAWRLEHGLDMAGAARVLGLGLRAYYLMERATANDDGPCKTAKSCKARPPSLHQPLDPCKYLPRKDSS